MPIPLVDSHKFKKNDVTFQPLSLDIPGIETTYGLKLGKGGGGLRTNTGGTFKNMRILALPLAIIPNFPTNCRN